MFKMKIYGRTVHEKVKKKEKGKTPSVLFEHEKGDKVSKAKSATVPYVHEKG
jgi:hypothetical protein